MLYVRKIVSGYKENTLRFFCQHIHYTMYFQVYLCTTRENPINPKYQGSISLPTGRHEWIQISLTKGGRHEESLMSKHYQSGLIRNKCAEMRLNADSPITACRHYPLSRMPLMPETLLLDRGCGHPLLPMLLNRSGC